MKEFFEDETHRDSGSDQFIEVFDEVNKIFARQTDARMEVSYDNQLPYAQYLVSGTSSNRTSPQTTFLAIMFLISVLRAMIV